MSRLWPDRLLVSLSPAAAAVARVSGGPRPRLLDKLVLDCDPAFGAEPWQGAAAALGSVAQGLGAGRLRVSVVLSNHFVRYAIVPFDGGIASPDEERALARFHFAKVHGERASAWDIRVGPAPRGAARLASAVDAGLIEAVRGHFPRRARARLVSVQPYLMSAFNLWRRGLARDAWLLLIEPQRACCARLDARGGWGGAQTTRGDFPTASEWAALLEQEALRTGARPAVDSVLVHCPAARGPTRAGAWRFVDLALPPLNGYRPDEDGRLALALTAR